MPEEYPLLLSPLSALAVCPFSLEGEITADEEASAPNDAAPVDMASPLPSWPDLTGEPSQCMTHVSSIVTCAFQDHHAYLEASFDCMLTQAEILHVWFVLPNWQYNNTAHSNLQAYFCATSKIDR